MCLTWYAEGKAVSESVAEFRDVHVNPESGRPVDASIREVMDTKPSIRMRQQVERDPNGRNELNRAAKVLSTKFVLGEKGRASSKVDGRHTVPAT